MLLAARGVERRFGAHVALAPTDLELRGSELVALVGPNGAGKSTLLALLAGALPPSGGRVERPDPAPRVGWAPQRPAVYGHLSARENLLLFARLQRLERPEAVATGVLELMRLPEDSQPTAELSVGSRQRLNLGVGLLGDPDVLLLDEPTASLDPPSRRRLFELLRARCERGGAVLVATHVVEEVLDLASSVVVLVDGRVVHAGPPGDATRAIATLEAT